ncbi:hypothetical protein BDV25DRAFT_155240 [Aspergillus avenaceus]|uniref:Uncharacterized protein n=1 Tax=Aspergillus avenaceus TaxID=36643 RepID=A0A5N6TUE6_ASPAV|nr:hypothetical protein BDV25DRAFT_155240 [Aspergillus avenaceus]
MLISIQTESSKISQQSCEWEDCEKPDTESIHMSKAPSLVPAPLAALLISTTLTLIIMYRVDRCYTNY